MKNFVRLLIYSNILIAICATLLTVGILSQSFERSILLKYATYTFAGVLFVYNFHRLFKTHRIASSPTLYFVSKNRHMLLLLTFFALFLLIFSFYLINPISVSSLILLLSIGLICVFYITPVFGKSLRQLPFLKSLVIAWCWTLALIAFPFSNEHVEWLGFNTELIVFPCYFFALTIPFDIQDVDRDPPFLRTLPQVIGIKKSKVVAISLLFVFGLCDTFKHSFGFFYIALLITAILITFSKKTNSELYFALIDFSIALLGLGYLYDR